MNAGQKPSRGASSRTDADGAAAEWLDSLADGACTPETFLNAMRERFQADREGYWGILSQLDQYYRRGKIQAEVFQTLKSQLQVSALGPEGIAATPRSQAPVTHATTLPHATPVTHTAPIAPATPAAAAPEAAALAPRAADREVAIGDVLRQRYRIIGFLGRGGMGNVFEATDEYRLDLPTAGQHLAVKVLHSAVTSRHELLCELQREFQFLQSLSHPHIVRVHEFDRDGDVAFFTMELLIGAQLSQVLGTREAVALPRPDALAVIRDVGAALSHAHSRGVVHGDINPQNIFITNDGDVRVLDFGASRRLLMDLGTLGNDLRPAVPVATLGYASCQLLEGQQLDVRDDVFAFACVVYLLLSGRHPFSGRTAVEARVLRVRPSRPPALSARQWRVLRAGLSWERGRRPADLGKWLERFDLTEAVPRLPVLSVLLQKPPPRRRNLAVAALGVVAAALLVIGGIWAAANYDSVTQYVTSLTAEAGPPQVSVGAPPAAIHPTPATKPLATKSLAATPAATAPLATTPAATSPAAPAPAAAPTHAGRTEPVRIELAADSVDVRSPDTTALVVVRRRGYSRGDAAFTWWTESGTAKPVVDFAPVMPHLETIADGRNSVTLAIPVSDTARRQAKSFYVVIDQAESGATLIGRTLTMITLQPSY
jgi:serine/threonine protein kinase